MSGKLFMCKPVTVDIMSNFADSNELDDDKIQYMESRMQRNVVNALKFYQ